MAESGKDAHESHQIAILVDQNIDSLKALLSSLPPYEDHYNKAETQLARFKLWAGSLGAHRTSRHRSMDYRLRDASRIRQFVVQLLGEFGEAIKHASSSLSDPETPGTEIPDSVGPELMGYLVDNDEPPQSSLDMALTDMSHVVDCLIRLSVTIMNPALRDQPVSQVGLEMMSHYKQYDIRHIREKFTQIENNLAERLGRAITACRQFLRYKENHYCQQELSFGINDKDSLAANRDQTTQGSLPPQHFKGTLDKGLIMGLDARSDVSATSYALSVYYIYELRVPPIPKESVMGPFLCPFCYRMIETDSRNDWKKHVFRDLQPYDCLAPSCPAQDHKFFHRSRWSHHMEEMHWRLWRCFCGHQETFQHAEEFQCHLRKAHPNDPTLQQQQATFEQICSQVDLSKAIGPCPLCAEVHISSAAQYYSHIGHHLEQLALFALPQIGNENDEEGSQKDSTEQKDVHQESHFSNSITASSKSGDGSQTEERTDKNSQKRNSVADGKDDNTRENPPTATKGADDNGSESKSSTLRQDDSDSTSSK
ncbi:hypothetical protein F4859DRAFT_521001 [Xylaria cf. heliscus]|nr:hypothetical protein F4859DRAFT_521001 [Xylaria cf. heliscus]